MKRIEVDGLKGIVQREPIIQDRTTGVGLISKEFPNKHITLLLPIKYEFRAGDEVYLRQAVLEEKGEISMSVISYKWRIVSVEDTREERGFRKMLTVEGRDMNLIDFARDNY